jgi:hypothetical protein
MKRYRIAALALLSWALIATEPSRRAIEAGFPTKEACEKAAESWRASYKRHLKRANRTIYPNRRRRVGQAIPPTRCVQDAKTTLPPS